MILDNMKAALHTFSLIYMIMSMLNHIVLPLLNLYLQIQFATIYIYGTVCWSQLCFAFLSNLSTVDFRHYYCCVGCIPVVSFGWLQFLKSFFLWWCHQECLVNNAWHLFKAWKKTFQEYVPDDMFLITSISSSFGA
jgi:hypothetical protein